jgi:hypothetical protein
MFHLRVITDVPELCVQGGNGTAQRPLYGLFFSFPDERCPYACPFSSSGGREGNVEGQTVG